MRITIQARGGTAVAHAHVTLTQIPELERAQAWSTLDWRAIDATAVSCFTNEAGVAELPVPALIDSGTQWALHVSAPGFQIASSGIEGLAALMRHDTVALEAAEARLRVVDPSGDRVTSARVEVFGNVSNRERGSAPQLDVDARRVFHRTIELNEADWTPCFASTDEVVTIASVSDRVSANRTAAVSGDVSLTVRPCFFVSGQVDLTAGTQMGERATVLAASSDPFNVFWAAEYAVRDDGSFGPAPCPWNGSDRYAFQLLSSQRLPQFVIHDAPPPGGDLFVRFNDEPSTPISVHVSDELKRPVAGAAIGLSWAGEQTSRDVLTAPLLTDERGDATLPAPATAGIWIRARKKGHAPFDDGPFLIAPSGERRVEIVMKHGGRIEGKVMSNGAPVPSFQLSYWPPSDYNQITRHDVEGQRDGRFVIEDVEVRELLMFAASKENPRSEIVAVEFRGGVAGPYDLELAPSIRGRGQLIDSETRAPIKDGTVQTWNAWLYQILTAQSEPVAVDGAGRFEVTGLRPGRNMLWINAPGYHWVQPSVFAEAGVVADVGLVPMERGQTMTVVLESQRPVDFTSYSLSVQWLVDFPFTPFDTRGRMDVPDLARGRAQVLVHYPDDSLVVFTHDVRRAVAQEVQHTIQGDIDVELHLRFGPECRDVDELEVALDYNDGRRWITRWFSVPDDGTVHVAGLPKRDVYASVFGAGKALSRTKLPLGIEKQQALDVDVPCRFKSLRVVDATGLPRASTTVFYSCVGSVMTARLDFVTDDQGRLRIPWPDCDEILLGVLGPSSRLGVHVALDREPEQVVRLAAPARLLIRLHDQGVSLPGITVWVQEPLLGQGINPEATDRNGRVAWDDVEATTYEVWIDGQGVWRTQAFLDAEFDSEQPHQIDVRRLGAVQFDVRGPLGEPLSGARVTLSSKEFGETTDDWVARGRLIDFQPISDLEGRVNCAGVPHGEYGWIVESADGARAEGLVEVPAADHTTVTAIVAQ
ncbi:MAG: carboxypeptidase-like regulatory domain-containing protein [Planctomycetes bacterium]|nr:carboxypeptidase-like regulatory domain-containing protein [Planctomycetota bacterium]